MDAQKLFDTRFNYQKIATKGSQTDTVVDSGPPPAILTTITVPHNLGYIPTVRAWFEPDNGRRLPISFEDLTDDSTFISETNGIAVSSSYLTTTDLVINYINLSGSSRNVTTYWRIYYDT